MLSSIPMGSIVSTLSSPPPTPRDQGLSISAQCTLYSVHKWKCTNFKNLHNNVAKRYKKRRTEKWKMGFYVFPHEFT
jgi:hypothetical protein